MIAPARRPSRRSSQEMCEPIPGTRPNARTSNTPPSDSLALRARSISATIASLASASRQRTGDSSTPSKSSRRRLVALRRGDRADPRDVGEDRRRRARAGRPWPAPRPPRGRRSRAREARSSTLRTSLWPYFMAPARSAWPGRGRWTSATSASTGHGIHALLPVAVVAVVHAQADRAAERAAVAHAGRDLGAVLLDLHAPAAPVTELAPGEVAVDVLGAQLEPGRKALDDRGQPGTVGLAGGYEAQGHGAPTLQTAPLRLR